MANFLSKFIAGAAGAGSVLLADRYREGVRSDLMMKRDAVLQKYRDQELESAQQHAETQALSEMAGRESLAEAEGRRDDARLNKQIASSEKIAGLNFDADAPRRKAAEIELGMLQEKKQLVDTIFSAKDPETIKAATEKYDLLSGRKPSKPEKQQLVEWLIESGEAKTKSEALKMLQPEDGDVAAQMAAKMTVDLMDSQRMSSIRPGDAGYQDPMTSFVSGYKILQSALGEGSAEPLPKTKDMAKYRDNPAAIKADLKAKILTPQEARLLLSSLKR